ncbi:MAG TPA: hypothetical protein VNM22_01710 [Candidatus Limnocylindrales bacterium]|nr:hypothetical protein [Candidatus Limnocylindrales bacterium]
MKVLLVILIVLLLLIGAGIVYVRHNSDQVTITIDKEKAQKKTEQVIETGKEVGSEALKQTGRALEKAGEKLDSGKTESNPQRR